MFSAASGRRPTSATASATNTTQSQPPVIQNQQPLAGRNQLNYDRTSRNLSRHPQQQISGHVSNPNSRFNSFRNIPNSSRATLSTLFGFGGGPSSATTHGNYQPIVSTIEPPPYQIQYTGTTVNIQSPPAEASTYGTIHLHSNNRSAFNLHQSHRERLPSYKSLCEETTVYLDQRGEIVSIGNTLHPHPDRRRYHMHRGRRADNNNNGYSSDTTEDRSVFTVTRPDTGSATIHDVTATIDANGRVIIRSAPRCIARQHVFVDDYTCCGILCAILFFPIGLVCCHACCRKSVCFYCGYEPPET
jgi:hypothetical protein